MRSLLKAIGFFYGLRLESARAGSPLEPAGGPDLFGNRPISARWARWAVPLGLVVGVSLAALAALARSKLTLSSGALWVAVAPVLLVYWLGPAAGRFVGWGATFANIRIGRKQTEPLAEDAGSEFLSLAVLGVAAAAVVQYVCVAALPTASPWLDRLHPLLNRLLFPRDVYGALVLMCMWGNASVLLAATTGRPAGHADAAVRELLAASTGGKIALGLLPTTALSMLFLVGWRWHGGGWASTVALSAAHALAVAVILFGIAMLYGWLLARRGHGHSRSTLLAAGLVGEIAFLIVFHSLVK